MLTHPFGCRGEKKNRTLSLDITKNKAVDIKIDKNKRLCRSPLEGIKNQFVKQSERVEMEIFYTEENKIFESI